MSDATAFGQVISAFRDVVPASQLHLAPHEASPGSDLDILHERLSAQATARIVRLWRSPQMLVTSPRLARREGFEDAAARSRDRGWPVVVRPSAGLTVALHPGVLNVSMISIHKGTVTGSTSTVYDELLGLLVSVCRELGISADRGSVPGAYCDGSQNLRIAGRKVAGASARLISRAAYSGLLSHACLTVYGNVADDVEAVRNFEASLGLEAAYQADAHCTVAEFLGSMSKTGLSLVTGSAAY